MSIPNHTQPIKKWKMPLWLKITFSIVFAIFIGAYMAGEDTRRLDEKYLMGDIRHEMQRTTNLLAALVAESVVTKKEMNTSAIIKESLAKWPEIMFIHIADEQGKFIYEWKKRPIVFGQGILKFEQSITYGKVEYGILSVYVDLRNIYKEMEEHIGKVRHRSTLILLVTTFLLIIFVNLLLQEQRDID